MRVRCAPVSSSQKHDFSLIRPVTKTERPLCVFGARDDPDRVTPASNTFSGLFGHTIAAVVCRLSLSSSPPKTALLTPVYCLPDVVIVGLQQLLPDLQNLQNHTSVGLAHSCSCRRENHSSRSSHWAGPYAPRKRPTSGRSLLVRRIADEP